MNKPKIGLLPFYLELYDKSMPEKRQEAEKFYEVITTELKKRQMEVITSQICRLANEFEAAVKSFEKAKVDAIVTLHLTYSPSLESSGTLSATTLPLIVLDTTPAHEFGPEQNPDEIMYNHGIHGVQDMCNLLIRKGRLFQIEAGHWKKSDVLDRVAGRVRAAQLVSGIRRARVGLIGKPFKGMGDFAVPFDTLRKTTGVVTIQSAPAEICSLLPSSEDKDVEVEIARDREQFITEGLNAEAHRRTSRVSLAIRRWIEKEKLSAFTVNFLAVNNASGLLTMPFLEASKAMARGIGYAGEGDVLTATLVGTLASVYAETSFVEMFCPDWQNDAIFMSHMGEMNINLTDSTPRLVEKPFPWTDAENPVVAVGRFRSGDAVLINLAPGHDNSYTLILAPGKMIQVKGEDKMNPTIHGWFKPQMNVTDFLMEYSRLGGTHHLAVVYGNAAKEIPAFAEFMGWKTAILLPGKTQRGVPHTHSVT